MPLQLVTKDNLQELIFQWEGQCKAAGEGIEVFAPVQMEHAAKIVTEGSGSQDYYIYSSFIGGNHECILHVNKGVRMPDTHGLTHRVMWVLLSPKYDYGAVDPRDIANVATDVIVGALNLCKEDGSQNVKIHIGNMGDREYFSGVANALRSFGQFKEVDLRGNWLYISL